MKYTHLTEYERYQISSLLQMKVSLNEIARQINRNKSTISREVHRNKGKRGYRPKQAHKFSKDRKQNNAKKITSFAWTYVAHLLKRKMSPEQIMGRLKYFGYLDVPSIESIYLFIYKNKRGGGNLHTDLRCQKVRCKRYGCGQSKRGKIKNRVDIDNRPAIVEQRTRLGDIEGDTVVGKGHKGVLVTLVDRVSREVKIKSTGRKLAEFVTKACVELLAGEDAKTITFDNGLEFARHSEIAKALNVDIYFAKPYHSWQRGTNENTNGLIRQFLPKSRSFDNVTDEEIKEIEYNLNNRPRKILGYLTPLEVKSRNGCVALRC